MYFLYLERKKVVCHCQLVLSVATQVFEVFVHKLYSLELGRVYAQLNQTIRVIQILKLYFSYHILITPVHRVYVGLFKLVVVENDLETLDAEIVLWPKVQHFFIEHQGDIL